MLHGLRWIGRQVTELNDTYLDPQLRILLWFNKTVPSVVRACHSVVGPLRGHIP